MLLTLLPVLLPPTALSPCRYQARPVRTHTYTKHTGLCTQQAAMNQKTTQRHSHSRHAAHLTADGSLCSCTKPQGFDQTNTRLRAQQAAVKQKLHEHTAICTLHTSTPPVPSALSRSPAQNWVLAAAPARESWSLSLLLLLLLLLRCECLRRCRCCCCRFLQPRDGYGQLGSVCWQHRAGGSGVSGPVRNVCMCGFAWIYVCLCVCVNMCVSVCAYVQMCTCECV